MGLNAAGAIGRFLNFARVTRRGVKVAEVVVDLGGGVNVTGDNYTAVGDDAQPLPFDAPVTVRIQRAGGRVTIGYVDTKNEGVTGPGEKRIYSRNAAGVPVAEVWLKSNGSILMANAAGSAELKASGEYVINGVTIDAAGNITTPGDVTVFSLLVPITVGTHKHSGVTTGPGVSGPPVP